MVYVINEIYSNEGKIASKSVDQTPSKAFYKDGQAICALKSYWRSSIDIDYDSDSN